MTSSIRVEGSRVVAAMTPPISKSPFNRGGLILQAANGSIVRAQTYTSDGKAMGASLSPEDLRELIDAGQIIELPESEAIPAVSGASLWALRRNLPFRDRALADLRMNKILVHPPLDGPEDARLCVVVEGSPEGTALLDRWRNEAMTTAQDHATRGEWDYAELHAGIAQAVSRGLDPYVLGLLSLAYENLGRSKRAAGLLVVARRSRGEDFEAQVIRAREHFRRTLSTAGQSARDRLLALLYATLLKRYPKLAPDLGQTSSPRLAA